MQIVKLFLLTLFVTAFFSKANNQLVLNYDGFFDRMDDLNEPQYQGIKLAFYLVDRNNQPCEVDNAYLKTKLDEMEVYTLANGEVLLPFDEKLDQDKAAIIINIKGDKACGLNMRLESNQLLTIEMNTKELLDLKIKFSEALDDLGGMMSFMLPSVIGLTIESTNIKEFQTEGQGVRCEGQVCRIPGINLQTENNIKFNALPTKISPWIGTN